MSGKEKPKYILFCLMFWKLSVESNFLIQSDDVGEDASTLAEASKIDLGIREQI